MRPRADLISQLANGEHPDIVIIGGGANGAGLFRDLSLQGLPTLLLEKGDFSGGTSSAPSRLIHGGLRYLETGEVALVRESAEERNLLLINAPHQVRPLATWVPLWSWLGGTVRAVLRFLGLTRNPGAKGALTVKAGLMVYDRFGDRDRTMPRHQMISRSDALNLLPQLSRSTKTVAQYFDALISQPERLVMELIGDAEEDCTGAMAVPYAEVTGIEAGVLQVRDRVSGKQFQIKPRLLINIAGAWVDEVQQGLGFNRPLLGGTKGSHIVLRNKALASALDGRMLYFETDDHRACLVYPLQDDRLFMGTTDIRTDDPNDRICSDAEIDYLFEVTKKALPDVEFSHDDIIFTVAGVRPLPRSDTSSTGAISRDHKLHQFDATDNRPFPMFTLVGGKWTTYRACAAQIADSVLTHLGLPRKADTVKLSIGGGRDYPSDEAQQKQWARDLAAEAGIAPERAGKLAFRYGSRATHVAAVEAASPDERIVGAEDYSVAEIDWICRHERVVRLEDIVLRRTLMAFEGAVSWPSLRMIAAIAKPSLGWTDDDAEREVQAAADLLITRHRMKLAGE